jgi:hypothetical protein
MTDTKFTPGPWIANRRYIGVPKHKSFIGEMRDHNGNWRDSDQSIANAHLIAAAPELYAALDLALSHMSEPDCVIWRDIQSRAKSALAKARGETQ